EHAGARRYPLVAHPGGPEAAVLDLDALDRRLVADAHPETLGATVVGVHHRLAAAEEEGIGARGVQRAGQRGLEARPVAHEPGPAGGRGPDGDASKLLVDQAAGDLEQVLPELLLGIGIDEDILRG